MSVAIDIAVRSSLVLTIGLLASVMFRKQPAALRHWLLAAALVLAFAQPLITRVMPQWNVATISRLWAPPAAGPVDVETSVTFDLPAAMTVTTTPKFEWARYLGGIWLIGVGLSISMLAAGIIWLTRLGSHASDAGETWQRVAGELREQLGLSRPVRLLVTRHPALLVTWGVVSPVVLLPADADCWPVDRVRVVLAHELAHLVRHDWIVQVIAEMIRATQWFNPLFWFACARLRRESEHACDDIVLESGIAGASYASHLLELARRFRDHRVWLPAPSIARPSTLERRIHAMLNPQTDRRPVSAMRRAAIAAMLLSIAIPIAIAAQSPAGASGRVVDPQGLPLPDATIRLASLGSDAVLETRTDANGAFALQDVPAGDYLLSARVPGFSSVRQRVQINGPANFDLHLQVGTLQETITVKSGAPDSPTRASASTTQAYAAPSCGNTAVGGNIRPPRKLKDVRPRFKQAWADANQEATVLLQALIGPDGKVKDVEVVSPVQPDMEDEAIAAVSQWEFTPTYLNCQAIDVRMFVTVSFKIDR